MTEAKRMSAGRIAELTQLIGSVTGDTVALLTREVKDILADYAALESELEAARATALETGYAIVNEMGQVTSNIGLQLHIYGREAAANRVCKEYNNGSVLKVEIRALKDQKP